LARNGLEVLFLSSEVDPFAKTGGLADVAGSLPIALERKGVLSRLIMPRYRGVRRYGKEEKIGQSIKVSFIENDSYFDRDGLYGEKGKDYPDNLERFAFFAKACLEFLKEKKIRVDLIHCNDWQTALVPVYLKSLYRNDPFFQGVKTVFTIHNLGYQGLFPKVEFPKTGLDWSYFHMEALEFYDKVNLLKGGLVFSDLLTTVSPTYSREIQTREFGYGLEGILSKRKNDLYGIINGIDIDLYNPEKDKTIKQNYSAETPERKGANKKDLQELCGLKVDEGVPLIGMISRLADQKGFDIFVPAVEAILKKGFQIVLLGTGDEKYETVLKGIGQKSPDRLSIHLKFDAALAQKIYAGSDFFMMPSRYEPCGLGQMISLRYGTIPIVRRTGGLADTIREGDPPAGNGFVFSDYQTKELLAATLRAQKVYQNKFAWQKLVRHAMGCDYSWDRSAQSYLELYRKVLGR